MSVIAYPISKPMRILSIFIVIVLLVILVSIPVLGQSSSGSISGTITDSAGNPLANISINAGEFGGAYTDVSGNYVMRGVPFGQYSVGAPSQGRWASNDDSYVRQTKNVAISETSPDATGVNFVLVKGGSISGTITDSAGNPVANISVDAGEFGGAYTDASGNYIMRGVPFSQYSVGAPSQGRWASNDDSYVRQTKNIAISETSPDATGVNFVLVKGGSISGTITDSAGNPLANISINAGEFGGAYTDVSGNYVMRGVPFGQYSIGVPSQGRWASNDDSYVRQTKNIAISETSPDATGVNFVLVKGGSISGTITDSAGNPVANMSVDAGDFGGAYTDVSGNYVMRGVPFGQYSVGAPSQGRWASNDGTHVRQTKNIDISEASPDATGVNFVLIESGSISGTVRDTAGNLLANISIDAGFSENGIALTDTEGHYVIRGVPFGQYSVGAPGREKRGSNDDKYIRQAKNIAISETSPDAADINFVLVESGSNLIQPNEDLSITLIVALLLGALLLVGILIYKTWKKNS